MDQAITATLQKAANLLKSGDTQTAQNILVRFLKNNPNDEQGWFLLSFSVQERDQQIFAVRRALYINPDFEAARKRLNSLEEYPAAPEGIPQQLKPDPDNQISEASALLEAGDSTAAKKKLREYLSIYPENVRGWYLLSYAEATRRGAINALRQALRIDPAYVDAQTRLVELQHYSKAIQFPETDSKLKTHPPVPSESLKVHKRSGNFSTMARYVLRRALLIAATIVIGIYITVLITNKGGQIDTAVEQQISREIQNLRYSDHFRDIPREERDTQLEEIRLQLEEEAGLYLSTPKRNLLWTYNALCFDWGKVVYLRNLNLAGTSTDDRDQVKSLVMQYLPNTLMLFGVANLFVFLFGIPLALYLGSRGKNGHLDRLISMLSPLSSIPSWVHGILLVTIFAVVLGVLPFGGKYDNIPPDTRWGYISVVTRHMILPVTAILLSMFFQLVYSWRTYFLIYSDEDYVELARAKGISPKTLERRYLLRPTMPFVLTSFALTLVGFWQMSTALEHFFNWPGIGQLYVKALPNFWGENFFPGEVSIILSIVVLFAYLLGFVVFALDITYAAIDPRMRLGAMNNGSMRGNSGTRHWQIWPWKWKPMGGRKTNRKSKSRSESIPLSERIRLFRDNSAITIRQGFTWTKNLISEIWKYPSAIVGISIITFFVLASLYTIIRYPYLEIGSEWRGSSISERVYLPKNVPAEWTNLFRKDDLPITIILSSQDKSIEKTILTPEGSSGEIIFTADFEYAYNEFPQDLYLYIDSTYQEKRPHIAISWITPDGREINPKSPSFETGFVYVFSENLSTRRYVRQNENWKTWFITEGQNRTPEFYLLFADPYADTPEALPGTYHVEISALTFEEGTDVDVELVIFGRVHGSAGTDYMRRDLIVPLLWGLPFTLAFGMAGAIITTLLAMIIAATGVWFGGWFDGGIQRLTEANMILPFLAVGILVFAYFGISLWVIMGIIILLNIFGSPTKSFRAAFMQVREAPYIEAARAYGASNARIIFKYMIPKIMPVLIPQLVTLIPAIVFLEATLGLFNVFDPRYPTWGRVIYEAVTRAALWGGSAYWVLEPISLLLLTGVSFALVGFALERILNPRLQDQ